MPALIANDRGAALVEVLIVIALSSLLIGLFLHADLTVNRSIMRWVFRSGLEQAAINLGRQLRSDCNDSDSLLLHNWGEVGVYHSGTSTAVYSFTDNTITRNGRNMLPEEITLSGFSLDPLSSVMSAQPVDAFNDSPSLQVLTITLERVDQAAQTLLISIRPYSARLIE